MVFVVLFVILSMFPLVNFVFWLGLGVWLVRAYKQRGSGARLLADALAATPMARALRLDAQVELVDSEVGPVLRVDPPANAEVRVQGRKPASQDAVPMVLHLDLSTGQWSPVCAAEGGAPLKLVTRYRAAGSQPPCLIPLAPLELEEANRDGLVLNIRVQLHDVIMPGKAEGRIPSGFLDRAAPRPPPLEAGDGLAPSVKPEDTCPVCAEPLGTEVVHCRRCMATQHVGCAELTGICPRYGCGS